MDKVIALHRYVRAQLYAVATLHPPMQRHWLTAQVACNKAAKAIRDGDAALALRWCQLAADTLASDAEALRQ